LVKKIIIVKNATAYTWDWYCHLVVDRASLVLFIFSQFTAELQRQPSYGQGYLKRFFIADTGHK
jgi:hypothetical protein